MMMNQQPQNDEFEISVFGPGYGECVLIHIGDDEWIIIDSCIDFKTKIPNALNYLDNIGSDPAISVKQIIASHWHDDHIRGLFNVVRRCKSAEFICSGAMLEKEFMNLVCSYHNTSIMSSSGIDEFANIIDYFYQNKSTNKAFPTPTFAVSNKCLLRKNNSNIDCEIYSLSPTDAEITLSKLSLTALKPFSNTQMRRLPSISQNNTSIVIWIKFSDFFVLLGADLEYRREINRGWNAIISSNAKPNGKAHIYKIPHHGSPTGDNPSIWDNLLESDPISILAPFNSGVQLPSETDVNRIYSNTNDAYSTAKFSSHKNKGRHNIVEKQIKEMVVDMENVFSSTGQVRIRGRILNDLKIDLLNGAIPLNALY